MVELAPDAADAYLNWGDVLMRAGRQEEAAGIFERGLERMSGDARLMSNLGNALLDLHETEAALAQLETAARAAPGDPTILRNLANGLRLAGDRGRAIGILDALLAADAADADSRCLRAFAAFADGGFAGAWDDYTTRWRTAHHEPPRPFSQPYWNGENLSGKTILVWGEQAVGDELMFATMLPDLLAQAGHAVIETEYRLQPLFRRSFPEADVIARTDPPAARLGAKNIDYQVAIGDLGRRLRRGRKAFAGKAAFLRADDAQARHYRQRYAALAGDRPRIGISWRSGRERAGAARSLDKDSLARLMRETDAWWLSLQYGETRPDLEALAASGCPVPHVDEEVDPLAALDPLAAQIAGLDMVISVANTTVHLAGGLGVPTVALLPHVADWRWLAEGETCLWYPSVMLARQPSPGDWAPPVDAAIGQITLRSRSADR